jgi:hypothetical protein
MRTVVELGGSNCSWCRNAMIDRLMARPSVREVHFDGTAGCLMVDHDHDSLAALLAAVGEDLRGWELADNGERVMVKLAVHEAPDCHMPRGAGHIDKLP